MDKKFIDIVLVNHFINGENEIESVKSDKIDFNCLNLRENGVIGRELYYRYFDEFLRGEIVVPVLSSDYYRILGYNYQDKQFELKLREFLKPKKKKEEEEKENNKIKKIHTII